MSSQHRKYWSDYCLSGIEIKARPYDPENFPAGPPHVPSYFWKDCPQNAAPTLAGRYSEAAQLIGEGTVADIRHLSSQASSILAQVFSNADEDRTCAQPQPGLVKLRLSSDLEAWRSTQWRMGNVLPAKKNGLTRASAEVLDVLGASDWPAALQTNNALFGCGLGNLLIGAADAPTLFSNYVTDMVFYYEHGYDKVFPSLEVLLEKGLSDPYALQTLGGSERRISVRFGKDYIQSKIELENRHKSNLTRSIARLNRREVQIVSFLESSLIGMAAEVIARGYDPAAVMTDLVFGSPGSDVVDVGSDLLNSEVMNTFLNAADITDTGIVSEDVLRRIYDAYAAVGAKTLTGRWYEPSATMNADLYAWHMHNDRHLFLRRALLGWPKARRTPARPQREADLDEAFDERHRTTGEWRPLEPRLRCDGGDTCDRVRHFVAANDGRPEMRDLWRCLVLAPLAYVRAGRADERREEALVEASRLQMARAYARGLRLETTWLVAHASHHAWQVNYLYEAAMFGSLLDGGQLVGKVDRYED